MTEPQKYLPKYEWLNDVHCATGLNMLVHE